MVEGIGQLFRNFNIQNAMSTFLGRKVSRYAGAFLDGIGEANLRQYIESGQRLIDGTPDEEKMRLKMLCMPYMNIVADLTPEQVYGWLPPKNVSFVESIPNGKAWTIKQLEIIKQFLVS